MESANNSKQINYRSTLEKPIDSKFVQGGGGSEKEKKDSVRGRAGEEKLSSPKRPTQRKEEEPTMPIKIVAEKYRVESNRNAKQESNIGYHAQQLNKANKQIQEQQKALE
jgi:hypothetical protein